jgi:hypothetical protein
MSFCTGGALSALTWTHAASVASIFKLRAPGTGAVVGGKGFFSAGGGASGFFASGAAD